MSIIGLVKVLAGHERKIGIEAGIGMAAFTPMAAGRGNRADLVRLPTGA